MIIPQADTIRRNSTDPTAQSSRAHGRAVHAYLRTASGAVLIVMEIGFAIGAF
ncbi:hypothetical protein SAMN04488063_1770 [Halopelagius inordinatus]|uniref:Uncharacterized protein n=1 Tax=Halopelagius inordinatus TaxID=553467 RepID=A0A1I2R3P3_9EURY|nr:hypothetical protein [Halopelagius inordinatus]SFG35078.1 hypothetical protein SAMN04488063_1770 [Halopelagius inordinatus]